MEKFTAMPKQANLTKNKDDCKIMASLEATTNPFKVVNTARDTDIRQIGSIALMQTREKTRKSALSVNLKFSHSNYKPPPSIQEITSTTDNTTVKSNLKRQLKASFTAFKLSKI